VPLSAYFYVAMALYAVAAGLYFGQFVSSRDWVGRAARWVLAAAWVAHAADIGVRSMQDMNSGSSVREALGALSWLLVGGYLGASLRYRLAVMGSFVAPIAVVLLAAARLTPAAEAVPGLNTIGQVHISLATIGVAIFLLAMVVAIMYLVEDRNLKRKRFDGILFRRGVALETLDMLSHRLVLVGFPIFTLSLMLGVVWVSQRSSGFGRPEYPFAAITWSAFAALIVARTTSGWRGRRAAWLTVVGFAAAAVVLALYLGRRLVS